MSPIRNVSSASFVLALLALVLPLSSTAVFGPGEARAESAAGLVTIEGLRLPCASCRRQDEHFCEVPYRGEQLLARCNEMLDYLLPDLERSAEYDAAHPSPLELFAYLTAAPQPYARARAALVLLSRSKKGMEVLEQNAAAVFERYPALVEELIAEGRGSPAWWRAIWNLPQQPGARTSRLRTLIALRHPELTLRDLYDDLAAGGSRADELTEAASVLRVAGSSWADEVATVRELLPLCSDTAAHCPAGDLPFLSPAAVEFLHKINLQTILRAASKKGISPSQTLRLLATAPYEHVRTPALHEAVEQAAERLAKRSEIKPLTPDVSRLLLEIARHDQAVARAVGSLLDRHGLPSRLSGAEEQGLVGVLRDFRSNRARARLADPTSSSRAMPIVLGAGAFTVLLLSAVLLRPARRVSPALESGPNPVYSGGLSALSPSEREELRTLRTFFGLSPLATEHDLSRAYRAQARMLHPDVEGGSEEAFSLMTEKYRRARDLLSRLQREQRSLEDPRV